MIICFFTPDIFAAAQIKGMLDPGIVSMGIRLPAIGCSIVLGIMAIGVQTKIHYKLVSLLILITCGVTFAFVLSDEYPIGPGIHIFQLLWYGASNLFLVFIAGFSLFALTGIIRERS